MTKSIADRKKQFLEDCCGGGPTMSMGDAGYQSDAPAEGPVAGYDPMLGKKKKKSVVDMAKRLRKEGYKSVDTLRDGGVADKLSKIERKYDRGEGTKEDSRKEDALTDVYARAEDPEERKEHIKAVRGRERQNRMTGKKKGFTKDISVMSRNRNK